MRELAGAATFNPYWGDNKPGAIAPAHARHVLQDRRRGERRQGDAAGRARRADAAAPPAELFASDTFRRSIGADMPSMPLAHNVRPAAATATGGPGEYQARLTLEMHGDWALRLKVAGPVKDQIVKVLRFTATAAGPPPRKAAPARGEHKH